MSHRWFVILQRGTTNVMPSSMAMLEDIRGAVDTQVDVMPAVVRRLYQ